MKAKKIVKDGMSMVVGAALATCAVFFFLMPSSLAVGSVTGVSIILNTFIPLSISTLTFILNVILLILGAILIGPEFSGKTVITTLMYSGMLSVLEHFMPNLESLTGDPLIDAVCYIFILGLAQAVLFSSGASTGGIDIIAKILSKYLHFDIGKAVSIGGICLAMTSVFVFELDIVVLSLLTTYLNDLNPRRRVCILSQKEDQICNFILNDLHSGASIYNAIGAYSGQAQREIITIVDKSEYRKLMEYIKKTDPAAFITVYPVHEVFYRAKK